mmetsp:Transcript_134713/g.245177  ORF Transcript_134713/g.245177 Transcript_134713/m.245177 type:complete len:85 (+) Transcript_134713:161-415(+)
MLFNTDQEMPNSICSGQQFEVVLLDLTHQMVDAVCNNIIDATSQLLDVHKTGSAGLSATRRQRLHVPVRRRGQGLLRQVGAVRR